MEFHLNMGKQVFSILTWAATALTGAGLLVTHYEITIGSASRADVAAIENLVRGSQLAEQTLCLPPPAVRARLTQGGGHVEVMPESVVAQVRAAIAPTEAAYYRGDQQSGGTALLQQNCAASMTGGESIEVAGGIGPVTCSKIQVTGGQANAACQMVKWLRLLITNGHGGVDTAQPSGTTIVNDSFVRTAQGWRIASEELTNAPGSGP